MPSSLNNLESINDSIYRGVCRYLKEKTKEILSLSTAVYYLLLVAFWALKQKQKKNFIFVTQNWEDNFTFTCWFFFGPFSILFTNSDLWSSKLVSFVTLVSDISAFQELISYPVTIFNRSRFFAQTMA